MKNIVSAKFLVLSCFFAALVALPLSARADVPGTVKVGAIDIQKVLNESESGKKAKSDLEGLIKSRQSAIDEKGKNIEKLKTDMEKQASVLSADARKSKEEELEKALREYQRIVQDSQTEIKKKEAELTDTILREIRDLVEKTAEEEGYTLVIEKGMVLYSSKGVDITDTILKKYDALKKSKKK